MTLDWPHPSKKSKTNIQRIIKLCHQGVNRYLLNARQLPILQI
jgi:hypothetical protein